ncbi:hypothetical protein EVAR_82890_1 [Eumeta japonica]|uniref:Uncharacterized protein n=1 Tax=Eumeta variegata TaxID=151549 RepID=A0A4C1YJI8_EUMVA|nr:hypothetical protein EVAR_82890_1 [Eumeta japonica]
MITKSQYPRKTNRLYKDAAAGQRLARRGRIYCCAYEVFARPKPDSTREPRATRDKIRVVLTTILAVMCSARSYDLWPCLFHSYLRRGRYFIDDTCTGAWRFATRFITERGTIVVAAESQESGSPPPSPADSAASEASPTLVHIKKEAMPPGGDLKDCYNILEFPETEVPYLPSLYEKNACNPLLDYGRQYLPRPLEVEGQQYIDDQKNSTDSENKSNDDDLNNDSGSGVDVELPDELVLRRGGVYARKSIPSGTKYGPFTGKWETQPVDRRYAWEQLDASIEIVKRSFSVVAGHLFTCPPRLSPGRRVR